MSQHPTPQHTSPARKTRVQHDADTWARIRSEYEEGHTPGFLAERWYVARSTIHAHKTAEDWKRQPRGELPPLSLDPEQAEAVVDLDAAVRATAGQAVDAVRENDHGAARELARTAHVLSRLARQLSIPSISSSRAAPVVFVPQRSAAQIVAERMAQIPEGAR